MRRIKVIRDGKIIKNQTESVNEMVHNLHKQQAPGRLIKNPTSARREFLAAAYGNFKISPGTQIIFFKRTDSYTSRGV